MMPPAHFTTEVDLARSFTADGGYRTAASILHKLADWLNFQAALRERALGIEAARSVTPFARAYPTPWRLGDREVVDCDGCNVQDFDEDPDTIEFWRGVVDAVNASVEDGFNAFGSGPMPIEPRDF